MIRLLSLLLLTSCGQYLPHEFGTGDFGNTSSIVSISGFVFTDTTSSVSSLSLMTQDDPIHLPLEGTTCHGQYTLYYLGSGGFPVYTETTHGDGSFEVPEVPFGAEGVLEFDCDGDGNTDQRCLVKAGDDGISCNVISDAVVDALETSLGTELKVDQQVRGRTIARMAQTIVEAANSDSEDANNFRHAISECGTDRSCRQNIMETSEVSSSTFEIVKTLAQSWQVDRLFTFATEILGYDVEIDWILYSGLGDILDLSLGTNFVAEAKKFVRELYLDFARSEANKKYPKLSMTCELNYRYYQPGFDSPPHSRKIYRPEQNNSNAVPNCASLSQITALFPNLGTLHGDLLDHIQNDSQGDYFCMNATNGNTLNYVDENELVDSDHPICIYPVEEPVITLREKELNRNDPNDKFERRYERPIFMIDIFENVFAGLIEIQNDPTMPNNCFSIDIGADGDISPPQVNSQSQTCRNWLAPRFNQLKPYFAGLIGLYIYLAESEQNNRNIRRFSLEEIYKVLAGENFLNTKMIGRGEMLYYQQDNEQYRIPPVLERIGGLSTTLRYQDAFSQPSTKPEIMNALNKMTAILPYDLTVFPYRHIPTNTSQASVINNEKVHRSWNRTGSSLYILGDEQLSPSPSFDPIYCKIDNTNRLECTTSENPDIYPFVLVFKWEDVYQLFDYQENKYSEQTDHPNFYVQTQSCPTAGTEIIEYEGQEFIAYCVIIGLSGAVNIQQQKWLSPNYDQEFDPYCDAVDSAGNNLSTCPTVGESLTFDRSPYPYNMDMDAVDFINNLTGVEITEWYEYENIRDEYHLEDFITCLYPSNTSNYPERPGQIEKNSGAPIGIGCPTEPNHSPTQGPIRLANIKPRANSYLVSTPRAVTRAFNYATKSVGQGVTIDHRHRVFTFDEALAFIAYRLQMPLRNLTVRHAPNAGGQVIPYARVELEEVSENDMDMIDNPVQGLLKAIAFPQELQDVPIHP